MFIDRNICNYKGSDRLQTQVITFINIGSLFQRTYFCIIDELTNWVVCSNIDVKTVYYHFQNIYK